MDEKYWRYRLVHCLNERLQNIKLNLKKRMENTLSMATAAINAYDFTEHVINSKFAERAYLYFYEKISKVHINKHGSGRYPGMIASKYRYSLRMYYNAGLATAFAVGNVEDWSTNTMKRILYMEDEWDTYKLILYRFADISAHGDMKINRHEVFLDFLPRFHNMKSMEEEMITHNKDKEKEYFLEDRDRMFCFGYSLPYIINEELIPYYENKKKSSFYREDPISEPLPQPTWYKNTHR